MQRLAMVSHLLGKVGVVVGSERCDQRRFLVSHACGDLESELAHESMTSEGAITHRPASRERDERPQKLESRPFPMQPPAAAHPQTGAWSFQSSPGCSEREPRRRPLADTCGYCAVTEPEVGVSLEPGLMKSVAEFAAATLRPPFTV